MYLIRLHLWQGDGTVIPMIVIHYIRFQNVRLGGDSSVGLEDINSHVVRGTSGWDFRAAYRS